MLFYFFNHFFVNFFFNNYNYNLFQITAAQEQLFIKKFSRSLLKDFDLCNKSFIFSQDPDFSKYFKVTIITALQI